MRRLIVVSLAALAGVGAVAGPAGPSRTAGGLLTGTTQISFGCPGPVREGTPSCHPWHPLAHARFSVVAGAGKTRLVRSDAQGHFALRLPAGRYVVTPLAQPGLHTLGGPHLAVRIRAGETTRILVRFEGFPQMA
jgi:hypothetical protein